MPPEIQNNISNLQGALMVSAGTKSILRMWAGGYICVKCYYYRLMVLIESINDDVRKREIKTEFMLHDI